MKIYFFLLLCLALVETACSDEKKMAPQMHSVAQIKSLRETYVLTGDATYLEAILNAVKSDNKEAVFEALFSLQILAPKHRDKIGNEVIIVIGPFLKTDDAALLHSVTATVKAYGPFALPVLNDLVAIIKRDASGAAAFSAETIGEIGVKANAAQDVLVDALYASTLTKEAAIKSLSEVGKLSPNNIDRLRELIRSSQEELNFKLRVAKALLKNESNNSEAKKILEVAFRDVRSLVKFEALHIIEDLGLAKFPWAIPLVENLALADADRNVRAAAAGLLDK
ncbi:MAG: hypothetical protein H2172_10425 [Opitutus sp.]|nr:hypothetical protein [Opitutus sp.]MCS6275106.1 hypothetical protein [Opitutus sp.]MCS6276766.1 hypothetical protein [Opitutus sp.]MCS6301585.1 hypothetical protein [Opitutus sp.]